MTHTDIANALLFGIPFVTCAGLRNGFDSLIAYSLGTREENCPPARSVAGNSSGAAPQPEALRIAVATSFHQLESARNLLCRRYAWRGYDLETFGDASNPLGQRNPSDVTFVVETDDDDTMVGTVTLGLDGPGGLLAERTHEGVIAEARSDGRRVCEVTRLAVADGVDSRTVLALLLSLSHLVARKVHAVTDVFIEVNPRHVAFYARALGFIVAAGERMCERVNAPSVLLRTELDLLEQRLALMATKGTMRPQLAKAA